ncbi:MAG: AAA family ATPase [Clostridia bacterium]|nr:AAA family ATPase [Clostridia bacterium]
MNEKIKNIIEKLPEKIARPMLFLSEAELDSICEIRLKIESFLIISSPRESYYLLNSGALTVFSSKSAVYITKEDIEKVFLSLTNRSVFAHSFELSDGYLSLGNGCRAGVTGKFYNGALNEVYSINIRIAKEIKNAAKPIFPYLTSGLLIAGVPGSGKTTILRDAVRYLSMEKIRVSVIDSRQEIAVGFDLGAFADVTITKDKAKGCEMALRSMSPQVIAFDEIGTMSELKSVFDVFNAGVKIITTAHAGSIWELKSRNVTKNLIKSGVIEHIALLSNTPGENIKILSKRDVLLDCS